MNVTADITEHLTAAARLVIAASGNQAGKYAIVTQVTVDADGTYIVNWERYGPDPLGS